MARYAWSIALIVAVGLFGSVPAFGQQGPGDDADDEAGALRAARVGLTVGYQAVDIEALNDRLGARDLPRFSDDYLTVGVTADLRLGSVLVGAELEGLAKHDEPTADFDRTLAGGRAVLNLGWIARPTDRIRVFPYGGVGAGSLRLESVQQAPVQFDDLLEDPGPGAKIVTTEVLLQAGVGADFHLGSFTVGARGGYSFAPASPEWRWEDVEILNGPDVGIEGFFLKASVGLGGWADGDGGDGGAGAES